MTLVIYMVIMALVTYLMRMIPFTFFRIQVKSLFVKNVLYYLPYAVLSAMTIPAIFYSTGSITTAAIGTAVALVLAYKGLPLIVVALAAAVIALVAGFII